MGLFSSDEETVVASSSQKLYTDTPNLIKDSVLRSVQRGSGISDDINYNILNSFGIKAKQMYDYARDNYTLGLPQGTLEVSRIQLSAVRNTIQELISHPIQVVLHFYDVPSARLAAIQYLVDNFEFDYETSVISNPPFTPPHGETVTLARAKYESNNTILVTYGYTDSVTMKEETVNATYTVPMVNRSQEYIQVLYYLVDETNNVMGEIQSWTYNPVNKTYPALDNPTLSTPESFYYPVFPFRRNNRDLYTDSSSEFYTTSRTALRRVSIKLEDVRKAIRGNPQVDEVDHAYLVFAVHIQEKNDAVIRYLHALFKHYASLGGNSVLDSAYYDGTDQATSSLPPINYIEVSDGGFRIRLLFNYINVSLIDGSIGNRNAVRRINFEQPEKAVQGVKYDRGTITLQRQITATQYEQVTVQGLRHVNYVFSGDGEVVSTSLAASTNAGESNFLVPLHIGVVESLPVGDRHALQVLGTRVVFNSVEEIEIEWYEKGFFSIFVAIVAVAITVFSAGGLSAVAASLASSALALGTGSALVAIASGIVLSQVVKLGVEFVVEQIGPEIGFLIAVAAIAYGVIGGVTGAPFANQALSLGNELSAATNERVAADLIDIAEEGQELTNSFANILEELEALSRELSFGDLNPLELLADKEYAFINESPAQYFLRTVHAGNIGVATLDSSRVFVDHKLRLPETVGETVNVLEI